MDIKYGFIDKDGYLHECDYGSHESFAERLVEADEDLRNEYLEWDASREEKSFFQKYRSYADFLAIVKGWVEICGSNFGYRYNIYYWNRPTKAQQELIQLHESNGAGIHDYCYQLKHFE